MGLLRPLLVQINERVTRVQDLNNKNSFNYTDQV